MTDTATLTPRMAAELQVLLDKQAITELFIRYYSGMRSGGEGLGAFFTPDGVCEVNGTRWQTPAGIMEGYRSLIAVREPFRGIFRMLLTNVLISVDGDTAKARLLWTGILSEDPKATPRVLESGREYDELIRIDGRWLIKDRKVIADSWVPDFFDPTYDPLPDYEPFSF